MASEKQIVANRRNASRSTGPKTKAGKKRASHNALRHGLFAQGLCTIETEHVERLAGQIAGDSKETIVLELARFAAAAEFDLARARHVRAALIALVSSLGGLTPAELSLSSIAKVLRLMVLDKRSGAWQFEPPLPNLIEPVAPMPAEESARIAEAVRRILPELLPIYRYEVRAAARRDRAIQKISKQWKEGSD